MLNVYKLPQDYLIFNGKDRLDLIQRLSTNDVNPLAKYQKIKTILTSDKGRFVDLITLFNFGDFVFVSCSHDCARNIIFHLDKYTIMDDFRVKDMTGTHETLLFFGTSSANFLNDVFGISTSELGEKGFRIFSVEGKDSIIYLNDDLFGGAILIYPSENRELFNNFIFSSETMRKYSLNEISDSNYQEMRITYGIPEMGKEMTEETNPLECGLTKYVSFTKGCYIGQEVIARLDTYDKISKHMVGIIAASEFYDVSGTTINTMPDENECGFVTSYAYSKNFGHIGLGFIKTIYLNYENNYKLKSTSGTTDCKLVKLPFENFSK